MILWYNFHIKTKMNDSMISDSIWKMSDYLRRYYGKKAIIMEFKVISPKKEKSLEETAQNALKQIKERYKIMEQQQSEKKHKRRVRYKGTHPRRFEEKYKELNPEKYGDTIQKVIVKEVHRQECTFPSV